MLASRVALLWCVLAALFVSGSRAALSVADKTAIVQAVGTGQAALSAQDSPFTEWLEVLGSTAVLTPASASLKNAELCTRIRSTLSSTEAPDVKEINTIVQVASLLTDCQITTLSAASENKIKKGLTSSKLGSIFYATAAAFAPANRVSTKSYEWTKAAVTVIKLAESDGSFRTSISSDSSHAFGAALSLQTLATIASNVPELHDAIRTALQDVTRSIPDLIKLGQTKDKATGQIVLDFSKGMKSITALEANTAVLKGIHALQNVVEEKLAVSAKDINRFADFFNAYVGTQDTEDLFFITQALQILAENQIFVPLEITFIDEASSDVSVAVTNVLGNTVNTELKVTASSGALGLSKEQLKLTKGGVYTSAGVVKTLKAADAGIYTVKVTAEPVTTSEVYKKTTATATVKVTGSLVIDTVKVYVSRAKKPEASDLKASVTFPALLPTATPVKAKGMQYISVKLQLNQKQSTAVPSQVFLKLTHKETQASTNFALSGSTGSTFSARVNLGSGSVIDSLAGDGVYAVEVIVGSTVAAGTVWELGDLEIYELPERQTQKQSGTSLFEQKKHTFPEDNERGIAVLAYVFSALLIGVFVLLLKVVGSLGREVNLPTGTALLTSAVFQGSIAAMLVLNFYYWVELNIFQAFVGCSVLAVPLLFSGIHSLKAHANAEQA